MGSDRIILDLCGGTGAWSDPYWKAGYDVRVITLPHDVRTYDPPTRVHGILAAPPCTEFARCGARWWASKPPSKLQEAIEIVEACGQITLKSRPQWWALENPVGRLTTYLGPPIYRFDPWEFGDPWTKKTWLWGYFTPPQKMVDAVKPSLSAPGHRSQQGLRTKYLEHAILARFATRPDWIHRLPPGPHGAALRSITPPGFAKAFFEANP